MTYMCEVGAHIIGASIKFHHYLLIFLSDINLNYKSVLCCGVFMHQILQNGIFTYSYCNLLYFPFCNYLLRDILLAVFRSMNHAISVYANYYASFETRLKKIEYNINTLNSIFSQPQSSTNSGN